MKKLLPPVLFLVFIALMTCIRWAMGTPHATNHWLSLLGAILLSVGLAIAVYHARLFKKADANIKTFDEPTRFVRDGLYRYSRNPMYLGFVIALLGVAFFNQAAPSSLLLVALFWLITDRWYIRHEEREMRRVFGDEYRAYCERTRRWFGFG